MSLWNCILSEDGGRFFLCARYWNCTLIFICHVFVILSIPQDLETQLAKINAFIRDDERVSTNPVMKVTFGDPRLFLHNLPQGSLIHISSVWSCRQRVSLRNLGHVLEQNGGRDSLPLLWKFLQKVNQFLARVRMEKKECLIILHCFVHDYLFLIVAFVLA